MNKNFVLLTILLSNCFICAETPKQSIKNLFKVEGTYPEFKETISQIITNTDTTLESIDEFYREIMLPRYLLFAEAFSVNLDNDPEKEYVSQVVFKNSDRVGAAGADGEILFLIFIQNDINSDYSLIRSLKFELKMCEYMSIADDALTFSFNSASEILSQVAYKYIKFEIQEVSSCGLVMDKSDRTNYFLFNNQKYEWEYVVGAVKDDGEYINRLEYTE